MKKLVAITFICATLTLTTELVSAQQQGFGIGASINGPTGISYKAWVNKDHAITGALSFNIGDFSTIYTHADFLFHSKSDSGNVGLGSGMLRFYYGAGGRLVYNEVGNNFNFGVRAPLGTVYQFEDLPADLYFELAPTLLFDNVNLGFDGALGFRYYLN